MAAGAECPVLALKLQEQELQELKRLGRWLLIKGGGC